MLTAPTLVELKKKIRADMGWPDRRTWTAKERDEVQRLYKISADHKKGRYTAVKCAGKK